MELSFVHLISGCYPVIPQIPGFSETSVLRKVCRVAPQWVAVIALASLPVASAGFGECMHDCTVVRHMDPVICAIICAIFGR